MDMLASVYYKSIVGYNLYVVYSYNIIKPVHNFPCNIIQFVHDDSAMFLATSIIAEKRKDSTQYSRVSSRPIATEVGWVST